MGINVGGRDITNLRYEDDTALLADNLTSIKRILHRVNTAGLKLGLHLHAKKTIAMPFEGRESHEAPEDIKTNGTSLEKVEYCKHLGSIKTANKTCRKDVVIGISMAKQ